MRNPRHDACTSIELNLFDGSIQSEQISGLCIKYLNVVAANDYHGIKNYLS